MAKLVEPVEGDALSAVTMRQAFDALRARYRREATTTDLIRASTRGPVAGATDESAVLGSHIVAPTLTSPGSYADLINLGVSVSGQPGLYAAYALKDRSGTVLYEYLPHESFAAGSYSVTMERRGSLREPLFAGLKGTVSLIAIGATTSSFAGYADLWQSHDGSETAYRGGQ